MFYNIFHKPYISSAWTPAATPSPRAQARAPPSSRGAMPCSSAPPSRWTRIRAGRAARSVILYGLRGVGKTVLLTTIRNAAEGEGVAVVAIEAPENRSLPGVLVPALRAALLRLDRLKGGGGQGQAGAAGARGLRQAQGALRRPRGGGRPSSPSRGWPTAGTSTATSPT